MTGVLDALGERLHLAALEADGAGGAGGRGIQPGGPAMGDLLGHLSQGEQLIRGGRTPAGVQDGADDGARSSGRRPHPALMGEVASGGHLKGLLQAARELAGRLEGAHDAGEARPAGVHGTGVVQAAQHRGPGHRCGGCPHLKVVQRHGHGGVPVDDGVLTQEDGLRPGAAVALVGGGVPVHTLPWLRPSGL